MRLLLVSLFLFGCSAFAACSLNPQPLPPDTADGSADATLNASPDSSGGIDSCVCDVGMPPTGDDAGDADATTDATTDASEDARDEGDASTDADLGEGG